MTEEEMRHRRIERMKTFLGEKSQFYRALTLMEKGMTDREVAEVLAMDRPKKERREIEEDTMRVLRNLMNGTASRGTRGMTWHQESREAVGSAAYNRRKQAYALLDRGATQAELIRRLRVSTWLAGEFMEQWRLERDIREAGKE